MSGKFQLDMSQILHWWQWCSDDGITLGRRKCPDTDEMAQTWVMRKDTCFMQIKNPSVCFFWGSSLGITFSTMLRYYNFGLWSDVEGQSTWWLIARLSWLAWWHGFWSMGLGVALCNIGSASKNGSHSRQVSNSSKRMDGDLGDETYGTVVANSVTYCYHSVAAKCHDW